MPSNTGLFTGVFVKRELTFAEQKELVEKMQPEILANPKEENPDPDKYEVPEGEELEEWNGEGLVVDSFLEDFEQYVVVYFFHDAHDDPDVPSNSTPYIYSYGADIDA